MAGGETPTIDEDKFVIPESYKEDFDVFNRDYNEAAEAASSGYQKLKFAELMTENFSEIIDKYPSLSSGVDKLKEISNENYMGALVEDMSGSGMTFLISSQLFIENVDAIIAELGAHPEDGSISIPTSGLVKWLEKNGSTIEGFGKKEILAGFGVFMKTATDNKILQILGSAGMAGIVGADGVEFAKKAGKDIIKIFSENWTKNGLTNSKLLNYLSDGGLSADSIKQIAKFSGAFVSTYAISVVMDLVKGDLTPEKHVEDIFTAAVTAGGQIVAGALGLGTFGTAFVATAIGYFGSKAIKEVIKPWLYVDGDIGVLAFREFDEEKFGRNNFDNVETINIGGHEMLSEDCISYLVSKGYDLEDAKIIAYYYGGKDDPGLLVGSDGEKMDDARVKSVCEALEFMDENGINTQQDLEMYERMYRSQTGGETSPQDVGLPVDAARELLELKVDVPIKDISTGKTVYTYDDAVETSSKYGVASTMGEQTAPVGYDKAVELYETDSRDAYTLVEVNGSTEKVYKPEVEAAYLWNERYSGFSQESFESRWNAGIKESLRSDGYSDSQLDEIYDTMIGYYQNNN